MKPRCKFTNEHLTTVVTEMWCWHWYFKERMTKREIAKKLGIRYSTVRDALARAEERWTLSAHREYRRIWRAVRNGAARTA